MRARHHRHADDDELLVRVRHDVEPADLLHHPRPAAVHDDYLGHGRLCRDAELGRRRRPGHDQWRRADHLGRDPEQGGRRRDEGWAGARGGGAGTRGHVI